MKDSATDEFSEKGEWPAERSRAPAAWHRPPSARRLSGPSRL